MCACVCVCVPLADSAGVYIEGHVTVFGQTELTGRRQEGRLLLRDTLDQSEKTTGNQSEPIVKNIFFIIVFLAMRVCYCKLCSLFLLCVICNMYLLCVICLCVLLCIVSYV